MCTSPTFPARCMWQLHPSLPLLSPSHTCTHTHSLPAFPTSSLVTAHLSTRPLTAAPLSSPAWVTSWLFCHHLLPSLITFAITIAPPTSIAGSDAFQLLILSLTMHGVAKQPLKWQLWMVVSLYLVSHKFYKIWHVMLAYFFHRTEANVHRIPRQSPTFILTKPRPAKYYWDCGTVCLQIISWVVHKLYIRYTLCVNIPYYNHKLIFPGVQIGKHITIPLNLHNNLVRHWLTQDY